jgi:uncharacterized protein (TIGR02594 family)
MAATDISDFLNAERELEDLYEQSVQALEKAEARGDTEGAAVADRLRRKIFRAQDNLVIEGLRALALKLQDFRLELDALTRRARNWPSSTVEPRPPQPRDPGPSAEPGGANGMPDTPPSPNMDGPQPAPTGQPGRFVQARKIAAKTILYVDAQGRQLAKEGGSRSWRNNNPGNIRKGNFATISGAIGDDGAFAIFPVHKLGFDAIVSLLRSNSYVNLTLKDAVFRYAPPNENHSDQYLAFLVRETGISGNTVLSTLAVADVRKIAKFIQVVEGWQVGTERSDAPPSSNNTGAPISSAAGAAMEWMDIAKREAALPTRERSQWTDPGENPRILEYFKVACAWFDPADGDEVDWCAAFVNYCLVTSGHSGTDHPGARSFFWNKKNQFVRIEQPRYGAIAVRRYEPFADPIWATGEGHVGFVNTWSTSSVELLGGNQSNTVKLETYPLVRRNTSGHITAQFVAFLMPAMN